MAFKIVTLCIRIFGQDEFKKYINAICDAGTRLLHLALFRLILSEPKSSRVKHHTY